MSFATLEEAWGMSSFDQPPLRQFDDSIEPASRRPATTPFTKMHKPSPAVPGPAPTDFAPAPQLMPRREEDDAAVQDTKRFLARTYARFGLPGLLRLLPREAAQQVRGGGRGGGGWRGGGRGLWDEIVDFVSCPEKVLFLLLCAFALLVVWDGWQSESSAAQTAATLASLQMAPFPVTLG